MPTNTTRSSSLDGTTTPLERGAARILSPFDDFIRSQATAGMLLFVAAVAAVAFANSPFKESYHSVFDVRLGLFYGDWRLEKSLMGWINEGLMALFFFLLGLEIKRELLVGDLRNPRQAAMVMLAALGGMIVPAAIYSGFNPAGSESRGWAIPMATDTAFALGAVALLAHRIPRALTAFLAALAIFDDIGAVLVIAVFYSHAIDTGAIGWAGLSLGMLLLLNSLGVRAPLPYALGAVLVWYWVLHSGIHGTVAGILVAAVIPARPRHSPQRFRRRVAVLLEHFRRAEKAQQVSVLESDRQHAMVQGVHHTAKLATTPLQRWEEPGIYPSQYSYCRYSLSGMPASVWIGSSYPPDSYPASLWASFLAYASARRPASRFSPGSVCEPGLAGYPRISAYGTFSGYRYSPA